MAKRKRKGIPKKTRFEVFKRDSFTCQYCGEKAPDVVLHIDHIQPHSKGGSDDILNLITSCFDCNMGKKDRLLSDNTVIDKTRDSLADLQERKNQMEMMFKWKTELHNIDEDTINHLCKYWMRLVPDCNINESGKVSLRKILKKESIEDIISAMHKVSETYIARDKNGEIIFDSIERAFNKIGAVIHISRVQKDKPELKKIFYIRGILCNTFNNVNKWKVKQLMEEYYEYGYDLDKLQEFTINDAESLRHWISWVTVTDEEKEEFNNG